MATYTSYVHISPRVSAAATARMLSLADKQEFFRQQGYWPTNGQMAALQNSDPYSVDRQRDFYNAQAADYTTSQQEQNAQVSMSVWETAAKANIDWMNMFGSVSAAPKARLRYRYTMRDGFLSSAVYQEPQSGAAVEQGFDWKELIPAFCGMMLLFVICGILKYFTV